ncbi:universal stress protein [Kitasatospora sp. NPDC089797]|uniref:universal stress protein n=1 Tax=Kitasatospora sp. NPDC089797 TaxID=3155298 RepID=UPI00342E87DF
MVTEVKQVIVGVDGSAAGRAALRLGADEAERRGAVLRPVLVFAPPEGEGLERRWPSPPAYRRIWVEAAEFRLAQACEQALADDFPGLVVEPEVIRGEPGAVLVDCATDDHTMLVVGTSARKPAWLHRHPVRRHCVQHATCPVLVAPAEEV